MSPGHYSRQKPSKPAPDKNSVARVINLLTLCAGSSSSADTGKPAVDVGSTFAFDRQTLDSFNSLLTHNRCNNAPAVQSQLLILATTATTTLALPDITPTISPFMTVKVSPYPAGLVNYPVWWSITTTAWAPLQATATAGSNTITITATPAWQTWNPGDNTGPITCQGPGTPWNDSDARTSIDEPYHSSPDCGYTYPNTHDHLIVSSTTTYHITYTANIDQHHINGQLPAVKVDEPPRVL